VAPAVATVHPIPPRRSNPLLLTPIAIANVANPLTTTTPITSRTLPRRDLPGGASDSGGIVPVGAFITAPRLGMADAACPWGVVDGIVPGGCDWNRCGAGVAMFPDRTRLCRTGASCGNRSPSSDTSCSRPAFGASPHSSRSCSACSASGYRTGRSRSSIFMHTRSRSFGTSPRIERGRGICPNSTDASTDRVSPPENSRRFSSISHSMIPTANISLRPSSA